MTLRLGRLMLGALLCFLTLHAWAQTEPRLALLIGNSAYRSSPLANPVNDVRLMETALRETGFTVIKAENASIREMRRLVRDFGDKLKASGGVGLFYFAGHGVQVRGENFLVSTDSDIRNEDEVADDSINASVILEKMQGAGNRMNLIVLDACRNNPFAVKSRTAATGLATMSAPSGSLVAYATAPGSVASDGSGNNGLYTQHLAKVIRQPGLPVEEVFKQVRAAVRRASNNQQTPWENTALEGQFYFKAAVQAEALPAPVAARPPSSEPASLELMLWESAKSATTVGELQAYLNRYPNGFFADMAKARMAALGGLASDKSAAEKSANARAESERAAAEGARRAAAERDAQAARLKTANELATAQASQKAAEERAAAQEELRVATASAAADAKLKATAQPVAAAPVRVAQQAAVPTPPVPAQTSAPKAGDVVGTMVLTDTLTGIQSQSQVTVLEADTNKSVYSTGDVIGSGGKVLQVRVGEAVLEAVSGSLWSIPPKSGSNGEATIKRIDVSYPSPGVIKWKAVGIADGKVQIESAVTYAYVGPGGMKCLAIGSWGATYRDGLYLPEKFTANINAKSCGAGQNFYTAELKTAAHQTVASKKPEVPEDQGPQPVATASARLPKTGDVIGTLVLTDTLTGIKRNMDVTVIESDAEKTEYSTGDVIGKDGRVLQVKMADLVLGVTSGSLWVVPVKGEMSGEAKVKVGATSSRTFGTVNWTTSPASNGNMQVLAGVSYTQDAVSGGGGRRGEWRANYKGEGQLANSSSSTVSGNRLSAELQLR